MSLQEKIRKNFTPYQLSLVERPDVTKSLVLALTKVVKFKEPVEHVVGKWVKKDVIKFLKVIPLITVHE